MLKRFWVALTVVTALLLGTVAVAAASGSDDPPKGVQGSVAVEGSRVVVSVAQTGDTDEDAGEPETGLHKGDFEDVEWDEFDEKELTPELIAEINAETDALVEHLTALGFVVTVETDDNGIREPVFADEDDEALWQAVEEFYRAQFAAEVAAWSDEEKAEHNAWVDEFVVDLEAKGITVETYEVAPGVRDIVWTEELELALDKHDKDDFADDHECDKDDEEEPGSADA